MLAYLRCIGVAESSGRLDLSGYGLVSLPAIVLRLVDLQQVWLPLAPCGLASSRSLLCHPLSPRSRTLSLRWHPLSALASSLCSRTLSLL